MHESLHLAVLPQIVPADESTLRLERMAEKGLKGGPETPPQVLVTVLRAPAPNPFNPQTKVSFMLARADEIELTVHDLQGALVKRLARGLYAAGAHELKWFGRDGKSRRVGSGVYLVRLKTSDGVQTQKMVMIK